MKKLVLSLALAGALSAFGAGFEGSTPTNGATGAGGFVGGQNTIMSVREALAQRDDMPVSLQGRITRMVAHEKYEFTDGKDTAILDIDDKIWRLTGITVTPNDVVRIDGFIDKEFMERTEIDVKNIVKIK